MKKVIMVKYAELTTKKDNRSMFINTLEKNIKNVLSNYEISINKDYYRMFIELNEESIIEVVNILKNVFGIHALAICYFSENTSIENIYSLSENVIEDNTTFKVVTNRSDKNYKINSMEVSRMVGSYLLKKYNNLSVSVHNPSQYVNIEIRKEGVYVYGNDIDATNGYPTGTLGKALLMLSGGIDSVVAGYLTMKRGVKLDFIYFESLPHTSLEARNKVIDLAKILKNYGNTGSIYVVPFTKIQEYIYRNMDTDYMITMLRRMMYRISERVAIKNKCNAIINGESIGQVASQTLTSMKVVNDVTNYPIIRPLASFDKLEIINIAKRIGSYEISILPFEDCCTVFVPRHPVINPNLERAKSLESDFPFSLIDEALENIIKIDLEEKEEMSDYL